MTALFQTTQARAHTHAHPRHEGVRATSRRTFLSVLSGVGASLLIPDWGQRVFPMYPRVHTITLDDYMFLGQRLQLTLPWRDMEAYVAQLREEASHTAIVRHALPGGRTEPRRGPNPHVAKTVQELLSEGWVPSRVKLHVDPVEREVGRVAICKRRIHLPADDDRMTVSPHRPRHLILPLRALERGDDGRSAWRLEQQLQPGGMVAGVWKREEA